MLLENTNARLCSGVDQGDMVPLLGLAFFTRSPACFQFVLCVGKQHHSIMVGDEGTTFFCRSSSGSGHGSKKPQEDRCSN